MRKARALEEEFPTNSANLQESCSSQLTSAIWGFHELLEMGMMRSLPEMDLDTARGAVQEGQHQTQRK